MGPDSSISTAERDRQLAKRIREDDASAFDALVVSYYNALTVFAVRHAHSHADAEDAVQDVFVQLWGMRTRWDIGDGSVAAYLYRAVRNRVIRLRNRDALAEKTHAMNDPSEAAISSSAAHMTDAAELQQQITAVFTSLPDLTREIFILNRVGNLTYHDIAYVLGVSYNTVRAQMARALRTLSLGLADWR